MANKMLIDATHPEETRVVVVRGNRVEEFDFESANRRQLRGNIYLAKVTRVEPSLQAAFVDLGTERNGFLHASDCIPPDGGYGDILTKFKPGQRQQDQQQQQRGGGRHDRRGNNGGQNNFTHQADQGLTWIKGKHEFKMGWDMRRLQTVAHDLAGTNGTYVFARNETANPAATGANQA